MLKQEKMNSGFLLLIMTISILLCKESIEKESFNERDVSQKKVAFTNIAGWSDIKANKIPIDQLTHINYAFGTVIDGVELPRI